MDLMHKGWWSRFVSGGLLALLAGCTSLTPPVSAPAVSRGAEPDVMPALGLPQPQPQPEPPPPAQPEPVPFPKEAVPPKEGALEVPGDPHYIPINLDSILRLAPDQNGQVAIAREKLNEAYACKCLADQSWLPDIYVGPAFYRHEGGIQDFNGNLVKSSFGSLFAGAEVRGKWDVRDLVFAKVDAERKIWQQSAEVSRITSETLLEATTTYVDLLAARAGEAIADNLLTRIKPLAGYADGLDKLVPRGNADRVRTIEFALRHQVRQLRERANALAAKLIYLLGLDPHAELVVVDRTVVPFDLVDPHLPPQALVDLALSNGPGIRDMEGLLGLIEQAKAKASGMGRFIPTIEVSVAEGGFGAGPGASMNWDNRLDLAIQARWNLTDLLTAGPRSYLMQSRTQQAQLTYQDLRTKLTAGVQEAHQSVVAGRDRISLSEAQTGHAVKAYDTTVKALLAKPAVLPKQEDRENYLQRALLDLKNIADAQAGVVQAIRDYDQAQLRLFIITGMADPGRLMHGHGPH